MGRRGEEGGCEVSCLVDADRNQDQELCPAAAPAITDYICYN